MKVSYDGTNYFGMQRQSDKPTIQQSLEDILNKLFCANIHINYAGRTDRGVHALSQVVDFEALKLFDLEVLKRALNALLPADIRVLKAYLVDDNFHSRYSCIFRDYVYIINTADVCMPFLKNYVWHVPKLNISRLKEIKDLFVGKKDFAVFSKTSTGRATNRFVKYIRIKQKGFIVAIFIRSNAFLRGMVRLIVGTMVSYAKGKTTKDEIIRSFNGGKLPLSLLKAPACGLYFKRAIY
ncbi:MAG: tRNA pseudouridine(38-40) synthase TruA [Desulfurella sp.]|uniref:tRNA pseudouridine(38-40) synthase TruA n=1 Tax=Desulfurella sp. TaxID=1962857 RepID=UPI003D0FA2B5